MTKVKKNLSRWLLFLVGGVMIAAGSIPFLQGFWVTFWETQASNFVAPTDLKQLLAKAADQPAITKGFDSLNFEEPVIVDQLDYGNLENWFLVGTVQAHEQTTTSYTLDIEKLNIKNVLVKVGGNNIDYNLVQFNTEPEIGGFGAPVIFGHSMLRQFYNPRESNKERYKGIFSTIMTLEPGDEIKVTVGSLTYTYLVTDKTTVQPDDDYILAQDLSKKQLKLVTCTPEGTRLRRGVVTAELKK